MKYGVGLFPTEPLPRMIHLAKLSERLGFSHIWIGDSHLIWREAYVNMAAAALNTSKVKIGTGVTNPPSYFPGRCRRSSVPAQTPPTSRKRGRRPRGGAAEG